MQSALPNLCITHMQARVNLEAVTSAVSVIVAISWLRSHIIQVFVLFVGLWALNTAMAGALY